MNRYGRTKGGSESDPWPEFTAPGSETGLEEGFWGLRLGDEESGYPERPDEANCMHYLRTGVCGYGSRCRFNHPRDRGAVLKASRTGNGEFPERAGQPICQYYMRTGNCKFGSSCKYHHPKQGSSSVISVSLNYQGYPLRPGEKECTYYLNTGKCKFGATCRFHHPDLQIPAQSLGPQVAALPAPALYPAIQPSPQQYGLVVARPPLVPGYGPYGQVLLSPSVVPYPSWSPYPAPVSPHASPGTQPAIGSGVYGLTQLSPSTLAFAGAYQPMPTLVADLSSSQMESPFPERPGQPECQHYMKTSDCKFGSSCRYHHPPKLVNPNANVVLSPIGLPLRPGAPLCTNYSLQGQCRFGPACKFNHPMGTLSCSPSASSLTDIPIAPYHVGPTMATLAGSTSSKSGSISQPGSQPDPSTGKKARP